MSTKNKEWRDLTEEEEKEFRVRYTPLGVQYWQTRRPLPDKNTELNTDKNTEMIERVKRCLALLEDPESSKCPETLLEAHKIYFDFVKTHSVEQMRENFHKLLHLYELLTTTGEE